MFCKISSAIPTLKYFFRISILFMRSLYTKGMINHWKTNRIILWVHGSLGGEDLEWRRPERPKALLLEVRTGKSWSLQCLSFRACATEKMLIFHLWPQFPKCLEGTVMALSQSSGHSGSVWHSCSWDASMNGGCEAGRVLQCPRTWAGKQWSQFWKAHHMLWGGASCAHY